jgi:hypothetical protein
MCSFLFINSLPLLIKKLQGVYRYEKVIQKDVVSSLAEYEEAVPKYALINF